MTQIAKLLDDKKFEAAYPLLNEAVKKFPIEEHVWVMYAHVGSELNNKVMMQKAFAKMVQFQPNDPDNLHNLYVVYAIDSYHSLASRAAKEFVRRFSSDSRTDAALKMIEICAEQMKGMLEAYNIPNDEAGMKLAVLHDRVQLYMHHHEFEKSIETANQLIKQAPDFIAPYNNLSLVYFMKGEVESAVKTAQQVLEKQPENFHALGNLTRFLAFLGKKDDAGNYANRLCGIESEFSDCDVKKVEAFAFLGDDELVVKVYKELEKKKIKLNNEGYLKNLAAFSFYQLGNEKKAKKLWKEASDDDYKDADENLEELELPVYKRNVFALGLKYWLPTAYTNELMKLAENIKDDENFNANLKKKTNEFFNKYPNIIGIFSTILERSDRKAKEFVIKIIKWSEDPEGLEILKDFALGKTGADSVRSKATMILTELKMLPKNVKIWVQGKQTDIFTRGFFITGESLVDSVYPLPPKAKELLNLGVRAMQRNDLETAENAFKKAMRIQEHPALINNLIVIKQKKGEKIDHEKELRDLHTRYPEYPFAAMSLGILEAGRKNVDAAKEILAKFDDKEEWHINEFNQYSRLQIEICLAENLFEGAKSWLNQMRKFNENFELTEADRAEFDELESRIQMAETLNKILSNFNKLLGKKKKKK